MKKQVIMKSEDFFRLKRILDSRLTEMETRDHWTIVGYTPPGLPYEGSPLQTLHKEIHELKKSLATFGELFESQYE